METADKKNKKQTSMNLVLLRGYIGTVKVAELARNRKVARISLATNRMYKNQEGADVEETTWHHVTAWGNSGNQKLLETLKKGDLIYVEGYLRNQRYTNSDGEEKYFTEIVAIKIEKC